MSDPGKYRTREEVEEHKQLDPILQVKKTILEKKFASEADLKEIDKKIKEEVEDAVQFSEDSPWPEASEAYKDVYAQEDYPFIIE
jgi:pyruvate dehydrogenase E1 component alpha subunit